MKLRYDEEVDVLYIRFRHGQIARTVSVSEYVNCDLDAEGRLLGIEVLFASRTLEDLSGLLASPAAKELVEAA